MDLNWKNPPTTNTGRGRSTALDELAAELRKNPGRWALIRRASSPSTALTFKKRGLETRTHRVTVDGRTLYDLYARAPEATNA